ncbi:hypothetical protein GCM10027577_02240 [Spirosoma fluminis]
MRYGADKPIECAGGSRNGSAGSCSDWCNGYGSAAAIQNGFIADYCNRCSSQSKRINFGS